MLMYIVQSLGAIVGVYCLSYLFNYILKKITKSENIRQKLVATIIATLFSVIVWILFSIGVGVDLVQMLSAHAPCLILFAGVITIFRFALRAPAKDCNLLCIYTIIFWYIGTLILGAMIMTGILYLDNGILIYSACGFIIFAIALVNAAFLVLKNKRLWY